jgi:succinoglycan biosynthesis transport protein ExoP
MRESETGATFRSYLLTVRRRRWWVIVFTVLAGGVSLVFSLSQPNLYSATAQLLVQSSTDATTPGSAQIPVSQIDVQTELTLVTSAPVAAAVARQFGSAPPVATAEVGQTNVMAVTATASSPARAADIANAYARNFVSYRQQVASQTVTAAETKLREQISRLAAQIKALGTRAVHATLASALLNQEATLKDQVAQIEVSGASNLGGVELVTPATPPTGPSSPRPTRDTLLGLAVGLCLGLGVAFARDSLDDRLSSKEATEEAGDASVLAMVPLVASWRKRATPLVITKSDPTSLAAEAYRSLRTSLQFVRHEQRCRTILITSPSAGEGKTSTLANLGVAFAQAGERVLVVSCDLRRPRLGEFFGVAEARGLTTVLAEGTALEDVIQPVAGQQRLWVLPAGRVPPNPAELLNSPKAQQIFKGVADGFDLVLIDSPPLLPVTDAVLLAQAADGVLLVAAAGQSRRADLRRAREKLAQVNATMLGIVLNQVTRETGYGYGYGYGHGYGYGYAYKPYLARNGDPGDPAHANGRSAAPDITAR